MRKFRLEICFFACTIIIVSGCTNSTPAPTKESNSPVVTSKASPTASIAPASSSKSSQYTNKNLGFSLELPASWKNKYSIEAIDNSVLFLHTESDLQTSAQGVLFAVIRYPGKMTKEQALVGAGSTRSLLFTTDNYTYVLITPTGVEYSDETEEEYLRMSADIAWILKTVQKY